MFNVPPATPPSAPFLYTPPPPPPTYQVQNRAAHVIAHHYDDARPGKPLNWLIPGALVALIALALGGAIAYEAFSAQTLPQSEAVTLLIPLGCIYAGGVFCFAYGWELYNLKRALIMTVIIVIITVLAVFMAACLVVVLAGLGKSKGKIGNIGHVGHASRATSFARGAPAAATTNTVMPIVPFVYIGGAGGRRQTIVNNVTTPITCPNCHQNFTPVQGQPLQCPYCHAVLEAHERPVVCPYCSQSYIPQDHEFKCPNCGAGTPPDLMVQISGDAPPAIEPPKT